MRGVCPECGCTGDLIVFIPDGEARQAIAAALKVMPELEPLVLRYLGMFRPMQRGITMTRTVALLQQLATDMKRGQIERKGRLWVAPLGHWRAALEQITENRDSLQLPLKSHGYLYEILTGMADKSEARTESRIEQDRRAGQHRERRSEKPVSTPQTASEHLKKAMSMMGVKGE